MTIEQIIEKQMQAYNSRDIDSMMSVFGKNIKIVNFQDSKLLVDGIDECRNMYTELFRLSPNLRAEIVNTISFDNKMIVHEYIYGRNGSNEKMEQVIIFEVNHQKITRIDMMRKSS